MIHVLTMDKKMIDLQTSRDKRQLKNKGLSDNFSPALLLIDFHHLIE